MPEAQAERGLSPAGDLDHLLDSGEVVRSIASRVPGRRPRRLPQAWVVAAAAMIMGVALLAAEVLAAGVLAVAAVLFVLLTGVAWGRPLDSRLGWIYPAVLRAAEYGFVVRVVAVLDPDALPAAYAYLLVIAYHHYDTVYRLRHAGAAPADWATKVAGGYDGRMLVVGILAVGGGLEVGLWGLAVGLGAVVVGESAAAWSRWVRLQRAGARKGGRALA